jgi:hypothetical protein
VVLGMIKAGQRPLQLTFRAPVGPNDAPPPSPPSPLSPTSPRREQRLSDRTLQEQEERELAALATPMARPSTQIEVQVRQLEDERTVSQTPLSPRREREEIEALYAAHEPPKLEQVDTLLAKYGARKLLMMVRKKYNVLSPRKEIEALYEQHNPEKLPEVDTLIAKYGEGRLLVMVRKKYGVVSPQVAEKQVQSFLSDKLSLDDAVGTAAVVVQAMWQNSIAPHQWLEELTALENSGHLKSFIKSCVKHMPVAATQVKHAHGQSEGRLHVTVLRAWDLVPTNSKGLTSNPYVSAEFTNKRSGILLPSQHHKTTILKRTVNPSWGETFVFEVGATTEQHALTFSVWGSKSRSKVASTTLKVASPRASELADSYLGGVTVVLNASEMFGEGGLVSGATVEKQLALSDDGRVEAKWMYTQLSVQKVDGCGTLSIHISFEPEQLVQAQTLKSPRSASNELHQHIAMHGITSTDTVRVYVLSDAIANEGFLYL